MTKSINYDHDLPSKEMASSAVYPPMLSLKLENLPASSEKDQQLPGQQ
jgi:hypothetical protein